MELAAVLAAAPCAHSRGDAGGERDGDEQALGWFPMYRLSWVRVSIGRCPRRSCDGCFRGVPMGVWFELGSRCAVAEALSIAEQGGES